MSIATWIAIVGGVVVVGVAVAIVVRSSGASDLGSVSEQWIAQHRAAPDRND
jgi:hypothetical protein